MALIDCPECDKKISDKAESCPHCGLPSIYFKQIKANSSYVADENKVGDYNSIIKEVFPCLKNDYKTILKR